MGLYLEGKTPQNVGEVYGMKKSGGSLYCDMCGRDIHDVSHKSHIEGRGAIFSNPYNSNTFKGFEELVLVCDENES